MKTTLLPLALLVLLAGCASSAPRLTAPAGDPDSSRYVTQADLERAFEHYERGARAIQANLTWQGDLVENADRLYHVRLAYEPEPFDYRLVRTLPVADLVTVVLDKYETERTYADSLEKLIDAQMLRVHAHPTLRDHGHRPGYERSVGAWSDRLEPAQLEPLIGGQDE